MRKIFPQPGQALRDLGADHRLGLAALALLQRLAHADDRRQVRRQGRLDLAVDHLVGLPENGAPLAVAEDHVVAVEIPQHAGGDLAREGAVALPVHVLRAELDLRVGDDVADGLQRRERRAEHHVHLAAVAPVPA